MAFFIDWLAGKKRKIVIPDKALLDDEQKFWQEPRPPAIWTWPLVSAMISQLENALFTLTVAHLETRPGYSSGRSPKVRARDRRYAWCSGRREYSASVAG